MYRRFGEGEGGLEEMPAGEEEGTKTIKERSRSRGRRVQGRLAKAQWSSPQGSPRLTLRKPARWFSTGRACFSDGWPRQCPKAGRGKRRERDDMRGEDTSNKSEEGK